jgi:hypothetical protein
MATLPTILLILAALSIGATVIAGLIAFLHSEKLAAPFFQLSEKKK